MHEGFIIVRGHSERERERERYTNAPLITISSNVRSFMWALSIKAWMMQLSAD